MENKLCLEIQVLLLVSTLIALLFTINSGRYGSASEEVRAGLRVLEDKVSKLDVLRQMLTEGEESGVANYSYGSLMSELDEESNI